MCVFFPFSSSEFCCHNVVVCDSTAAGLYFHHIYRNTLGLILFTLVVSRLFSHYVGILLLLFCFAFFSRVLSSAIRSDAASESLGCFIRCLDFQFRLNTLIISAVIDVDVHFHVHHTICFV